MKQWGGRKAARGPVRQGGLGYGYLLLNTGEAELRLAPNKALSQCRAATDKASGSQESTDFVLLK